ncbi:MAG TPA: GNAT family N-acetyltransferase [Gemmatimonadota bacterium]|nr:GNAT family N-acetyltransferase [Gemmatimonadota bacterium]
MAALPSDVHIEPLTPSDIDELLPLMREFYAGERLPWDETVVRRALDALWGEPLHGGAWLARAGNDVVGYGVLCCGFSLEYRGRDAFVDELFVRPTWRDQGVGGHILDAMESACRSQGIAALHLEVDHDNPDGKRLYLRRGFVDHERHLMTKWLDP